MKVREIVAKYSDVELAPLGVSEQKKQLNADERQHLRDDLSAAITRNRSGFFIAVSLIVALFVINIGIVLTHLNDPTTIGTASGVLGVSAAGLIAWMVQLWSEKSRLEMLAVFALNLEGDALKTLLNVLSSSPVVLKS